MTVHGLQVMFDHTAPRSRQAVDAPADPRLLHQDSSHFAHGCTERIGHCIGTVRPSYATCKLKAKGWLWFSFGWFGLRARLLGN